jgi:hypothetical protein
VAVVSFQKNWRKEAGLEKDLSITPGTFLMK